MSATKFSDCPCGHETQQAINIRLVMLISDLVQHLIRTDVMSPHTAKPYIKHIDYMLELMREGEGDGI